MKRFLLIAALILLFGQLQASAIPNPWVDCGSDMACGADKAGFSLPIKVKIYNVRAMDGLFEIKFALDKKRNVSVRKTQTYSGNDLSGVYENYPVNKTISLIDGVLFNVRGDNKRFYVVNFAAETGYYSLYSKEGMKEKDIKYLYNLIKDAETK